MVKYMSLSYPIAGDIGGIMWKIVQESEKTKTTSRLVLLLAMAAGAAGCENVTTFSILPATARVFSMTTPEDMPLQATLECGYTDHHADRTQFALLSPPSHGALTLLDAKLGRFSYVPAADYNGSDSFQYQCSVTDEGAPPTTNTANLQITPVNDAPVADRGTFQLNAELSLDMDLTGQVTDVDNAISELTCSPDPGMPAQHGKLEAIDGLPCSLRYTPTPGFHGIELVGYIVKDPAGLQGKNILDITVGNNLNHLKPALAVRAAGCLMCHTAGIAAPNVSNANVITDFGFGAPWYWLQSPGFNDWSMNLIGGANPPPSPAIHGVGQSSNWGSTLITNGSVVVPAGARVPASYIGATTDAGWNAVSFTLKEYLDRQASFGVAAGSARFAVSEASSIYVGAPTADAIRTGANFWIPGDAKLKYVKQNRLAPELTGLRQVGSGASLYFTADNSAPITCVGDVVIDAPVWLNQTRVITNNSGCRIYSTASIFVTGALPVSPSDAAMTDYNLQLASSRGIFMGLGPHDGYEDAPTGRANSGKTCQQINVDSLHGRLDDTRFGNRMRIATTDAAYNTFKAAVYADEATIPQLTGACILPQYKDISFERLLLNAPYVGGRYTQPFKGSLIAEIISWLPGKFAFEFDPVFQRVPVLPLLDFKQILDVTQ